MQRPVEQKLYKNIAENVLENKLRVPVVYPEMGTFGYLPGAYYPEGVGLGYSPQRSRRTNPCQC